MRTIDGVEMLDVREAATMTGRTAETVRRWVWSGRLEARRDGNRLLVARADVMRVAGGSKSRRQAGGEAVSLAEWAADASAAQRAGGKRATASDLVLDDRAERDARAGR